MEGDSTSVKSDIKPVSTPSSLKTPNILGNSGVKRQVAFQRPTLIIPPPQGVDFRRSPATATAGTIYTAQSINNAAYNRKASMFMFDQFSGLKGFTKSGLGFGEKCAYWLYNKVKKWSRKWFTHIFLSVVLILYTIGGALLFEFIEGLYVHTHYIAVLPCFIAWLLNLSALHKLNLYTQIKNSIFSSLH